MRRAKPALIAAVAAATTACSSMQAPPQTLPQAAPPDLVQHETAFSDRSADLPPGACHAHFESSPTAKECIERAMVRMHVSDLNGNGLPDVTVLRADGTETLYTNLGGNFTREDREAGPEWDAWKRYPTAQDQEEEHSVIRMDLNGDGRSETIRGEGGLAQDANHADHHAVSRPPSIRNGKDGTIIHPLDLERRRLIGFSEMIWVGDATGDLVPDIIIAGSGMLHPQLYIGKSSPALFSAIEIPAGREIILDGHRMQRDRKHGNVTTDTPVTVRGGTAYTLVSRTGRETQHHTIAGETARHQ